MIEVFRNLDWSVLTNFLLAVIPTVICLTLHEYAHARVALALGDTTAKDAGRLTLNPFKSFDIMGFFMMALVGFGWAKPVPVDMRYFKQPKRGMALVAVAGPLCNLVIAVVAFFLYGLLFRSCYASKAGGFLLDTVYLTGGLSVSFAVFNVIPIPPLDGSKVLFSLVSDEAYYKFLRYERYGMLILFALLVTGVIDKPLNAATRFMLDKFFWFAELGYRITG